MLSPLIRRPGRNAESRSKERGVTMALVAVTMAVLISLAALSIDVGTLYEAKAEAQRAADAAALTAARVISISGITGDPANSGLSWQPACGGAASYATLAAIKMAQQNLIGGVAVASGSVQVNYVNGKSGGAGNADCSTFAGGDFSVNPIVTVSVQRTNLPIFFAHIFSLFGSTFSSASVSATATAEAYNPSGAIPLVPLNPRCVKPWFVPNLDPGNSPNPFVTPTTGQIWKPGISPTGPIGETFNLKAACGPGPSCVPPAGGPVVTPGSPPALGYLPGLVSNASVAIAANSKVPACSNATNNNYIEAIAGCDQSTLYACGASLTNTVDLTEYPGPPGNDSVNGAQCLINETANGLAQGQDSLAPPGPSPYFYPFQIVAGSESALLSAGITSGTQITSSPSIVSLPIYDSVVTTFIPPHVTVVGFLQVFINRAGSLTQDINVTVMNVAGCGNSFAGPPVAVGTSPVPIRLITPP